MTEFEDSWQSFIQSGNFLELTRQWENGISTPQTITLANGLTINLIDSGLLEIEPEETSHTSVLISSGIHGNETAPMEIVDQMVKDIFSGQLKVSVRLMLIIGNPPAVNIGKRFLSQNLNRLFSNRHDNCEQSDYETNRAEVIEKAVVNFYQNAPSSEDQQRYHFDLHTAIRPSKFEKFVLYPYLHEKPWDKNHIAFFGGADITTVLLGNQPAGTFSYFTSHQFNAMAATVELGKVKPFGENDMQNFSGIDKNLRRLIQAQPVKQRAFNNNDYKVFKVKQEIIKENENYQLLLDDDVKNFTAFERGTVLASDKNGNDYVVEKNGEAIVFPNNHVPVGQRVGVLLEEINL